ncbi:hypothetical protein MASR2M70_03340 [Bacillota bacterium]
MPVPQITDPKSFNKELLTQCDEDGKNHHKKDEEITTLHLEDKANLLPLPQARFEACRYELVRVDSCSKFKLEKGAS